MTLQPPQQGFECITQTIDFTFSVIEANYINVNGNPKLKTKEKNSRGQ